jgi:putative exporter of polyketide antibiotics
MAHYFALLSTVFMMVFVVLFEKVHDRRKHEYGLVTLMTPEQVDRIRRIMAACQEA